MIAVPLVTSPISLPSKVTEILYRIRSVPSQV